MGLAFLAFLGLMIFSPVSRRVTLLLALSLAGYVAFDNLVTETAVPPQRIAVRNVDLFVFGDDTGSPMVKVGFDVRNGEDDELESVDILVVLESCAAGRCNVAGRQRARVQLMAPAHSSRHAEALVHFANLVPATGGFSPKIRLLGGTVDRY